MWGWGSSNKASEPPKGKASKGSKKNKSRKKKVRTSAGHKRKRSSSSSSSEYDEYIKLSFETSSKRRFLFTRKGYLAQEYKCSGETVKGWEGRG